MNKKRNNSINQAGILRRTATTLARAYAKTLGDMLPNLSTASTTLVVVDAVTDTLVSWAEKHDLPWSEEDVCAVEQFAIQEVKNYLMPF